MACVTVDIREGKVRGVNQDGVLAFLGIPYGSDTSGSRFQPAAMPKPWGGIRDCFEFGPQAPQGRLNVDGMQLGGADPNHMRAIGAIFSSGVTPRLSESEDCLVLNVYKIGRASCRERV